MRTRGVRCSLIVAVLGSAICAGQTPGGDFDAKVNRAIDIWSADHGTVVTRDARDQLFHDARMAVTETTRQHPELNTVDVAGVVPLAMAAFLTDTQNNATAATLHQKVQERVTGFGQVLPAISDYPTLAVNVSPPRPPDFVVSINGVAYQAGSTLFRVKVGVAQIHIARSGHGGCDRSITVTQSGPNVVTCRL